MNKFTTEGMVFTIDSTPIPLPDVMMKVTDVTYKLLCKTDNEYVLSDIRAKEPEELSKCAQQPQNERLDLNIKKEIIYEENDSKVKDTEKSSKCMEQPQRAFKNDDPATVPLHGRSLLEVLSENMDKENFESSAASREQQHTVSCTESPRVENNKKHGPQLKYTTGQNADISNPPFVPADILVLNEHNLNSFVPKSLVAVKAEFDENIKKEVEENDQSEQSNSIVSAIQPLKESIEAVDLISSSDKSDAEEAETINSSKYYNLYKYKVPRKVVERLKKEQFKRKLKKMLKHPRRRHSVEGDDTIAQRVNSSNKRVTRVMKKLCDYRSTEDTSDSDSSSYDKDAIPCDNHGHCRKHRRRVRKNPVVNLKPLKSTDINRERNRPRKRDRTPGKCNSSVTHLSHSRGKPYVKNSDTKFKSSSPTKRIKNLSDFLDSSTERKLKKSYLKKRSEKASKLLKHKKKLRTRNATEVDENKNLVKTVGNQIFINYAQFNIRMKELEKKKRKTEIAKKLKKSETIENRAYNKDCDKKPKRDLNSKCDQRYSFSIECFKLGSKLLSTSTINVEIQQRDVKSFNRRMTTKDMDLDHGDDLTGYEENHDEKRIANTVFQKNWSSKKVSGSYRRNRTVETLERNKKRRKSCGSYALQK